MNKKNVKPRARWVDALMCNIKWKILVKLTVANELSDIEWAAFANISASYSNCTYTILEGNHKN